MDYMWQILNFMDGDESIFTYDIYFVLYPMICFPMSKFFGILSDLLISGLVIVEVILILVYENLYGVYATYVS